MQLQRNNAPSWEPHRPVTPKTIGYHLNHSRCFLDQRSRTKRNDCAWLRCLCVYQTSHRCWSKREASVDGAMLFANVPEQEATKRIQMQRVRILQHTHWPGVASAGRDHTHSPVRIVRVLRRLYASFVRKCDLNSSSELGLCSSIELQRRDLVGSWMRYPP